MIPRIGRIQIERTKTNKEALKIEETYFPKIKKIFKTITKEYEGRLHFLPYAEKQYGSQINALIKSMVTKTYLLGMEYIARATGKPEHVSISSNDITQIMLQTDEAYRMFWRLITKYLTVKRNRSISKVGQVTIHRKLPTLETNKKNVTITDEVFQMMDDEDNRLLDEDTSTDLIISGIVTTTLALATFEKFKEYKQDQEELNQELVFEDFEEGDEFLDTFPMEGDKYVWASELDDRVCSTCSALEGQEWDIDDPSVLIPRQDSHFGCRCRILIKIGDKIINK